MVCNLKMFTYLLHLTSVYIPCYQSTTESGIIFYECQFKVIFYLSIQSNTVFFFFFI